MAQRDTDQPVCILAIGLERMMARAVRADFPGAKVVARRTLGSDPGRWPRGVPNLVLINGAQNDAAGQRAAIWQRWGDAVVVTEIDSRRPIARVWRSATDVELVEVGPGFLLPYLPSLRAHARQSALPFTALRMVGYLTVLWNLTIGVHVAGLSQSGVMLTMLAFAVLLMDLVYRSQRSHRAG